MTSDRATDAGGKVGQVGQDRMTGHDHDDGMFTLPTAPSGSWEELTANEQAWIEFIRIISCGSDPQVTPTRIRALRELLDAGRR